MKRKKALSLIAILLAVLMLLSLVVSVIPFSAYADEMDELYALRAKKDELSGQVREIRERIEGLQAQKSNVLEQMVALEERNRLAEEQLAVIEEEIRTLSDGDLAYLSVGGYSEKFSLSSVIGNAARHVAGAAGETTSKFESRGIGTLVMADGPAGLRLSRDYYTAADGAHAVGESSISESFLDLMDAPTRKIASLVMGGVRAPKKTQLRHQYCTAIPIGTAIAQSWNLEFAHRCGDIVG